MQIATLCTPTPALLASGVGAGGLGSLSLNHNHLKLLWLPFHPQLQFNLPLAGLLDHIIQGLTPQEAHKLPNTIP